MVVVIIVLFTLIAVNFSYGCKRSLEVIEMTANLRRNLLNIIHELNLRDINNHQLEFDSHNDDIRYKTYDSVKFEEMCKSTIWIYFAWWKQPKSKWDLIDMYRDMKFVDEEYTILDLIGFSRESI